MSQTCVTRTSQVDVSECVTSDVTSKHVSECVTRTSQVRVSECVTRTSQIDVSECVTRTSQVRHRYYVTSECVY